MENKANIVSYLPGLCWLQSLFDSWGSLRSHMRSLQVHFPTGCDFSVLQWSMIRPSHRCLVAVEQPKAHGSVHLKHVWDTLNKTESWTTTTDDKNNSTGLTSNAAKQYFYCRKGLKSHYFTSLNKIKYISITLLTHLRINLSVSVNLNMVHSWS